MERTGRGPLGSPSPGKHLKVPGERKNPLIVPEVVERDFLASIEETPDVRGAVIVGSQGKHKILEIVHQHLEVVDSHPDVEERVEEGLVASPLDLQILSNGLCHIGHDLHQPFCPSRDTEEFWKELSMPMRARMTLGSWLYRTASS